MSLHRRAIVDAEPPDIGFQAAFGFYLGLIAAGLVAVVGLLADVTTASLLATLPTTVTGVMIVGHVLAKRFHGLPELIGRRLRWRLACYLPAVGLVAVALAPGATPLAYTARYLAITVAMALLVGVTAFGLERLCRARFVEAITTDEPVVTWSYRPAGLLSRNGLWMVLTVFVVMAGVMSVVGGTLFGLLWLAYGVIVVAWTWSGTDDDSRGKSYYGKRYSLEMAPEPDEWGELRAHEYGVRLDLGRSRRFVPWERIEGIELTDDELVLKRRFRNLRCDRDAIDDPEAEAVLEALETARDAASRR
ncbi:hypothetical protein [Natrarchaeobius oligotrophus]|uniref:Uncharacterized protein n=1 Tax=Natrarchaeobius chitinivorans TaxID=1679083 RepID=A0A3N6PHU8_NATCH|nr:hypothetical protein [Natrarchaeobius chitinivorans]RQH00310.1 hypothetical protein EA472_10625 [Natrarchaeobius chitinivorans]